MSSAPAPRVRFCPAPSGWLHVGSVRAALYNHLHARRHGGTFVFRIEDTDASRATEESMRSMMEAMAWIGLAHDEGPELAGDGFVTRGEYGPYRQSERTALYGAVARRLEAAGATYRDHRTAEELEAWREAQRAGQGEGPPVVKASRFEHTPEELERFAAEGRPASLRLRTPESGTVAVDDLVRGEVRWDWAQISDPVIARSDGSATYPLANSVDDLAQGITLICRGEDLLSVTPRQVLLHELLTADDGEGSTILDAALAEVGLPARDPSWTRPQAFAHLPMVVGMDRKKLSKRHGSVSIQEFARQGFLPETLRNYLALLGWAPKDGRERLDDDELVAEFELAAVGRSAAAFDVDKLTAFNGERIRDLDPDELAERLVPFLDGTYGDEALVDTPPSEQQVAVLRGLVPLVQERMQRLDEVQRYAPAFLREAVDFEADSVTKVFGKAGSVEAIEAAGRVLANVDFDVEAIESALRGLPEELGIGFGKVAQPIRVAVTGSSVSPPLFESIELLGRQRTLARLEAALPVARDARGER
ncbi:glutamate--tRNA ligase [Egicoccus halophilus]|uniref:Glutamate--tRNA ligase n=1 Tax=Egicoccus halophilus TaxID=1670830 RepID=A0A8J3ES30_9ACTN|nr:glutamate--tRNA ligase family protein [Egicoccus halophilus]GGI06372.1 glutamate--tRNA ligase [Egicoccus halophilus]